MNMHLHYALANGESKNWATQWVRLWDEIATRIVEFKVRILVGDFNMALFRVVPELRARGVPANLGATYMWKNLPSSEVRIDSCAILVIGPCNGIHMPFDAKTILGSAVAETVMAPPAWRPVTKKKKDKRGRAISEEPWPLHEYDGLGQGCPLKS